MELETNAIPRARDHDDTSRMVALTTAILTTDWNLDVEAFAPLPGLGHLDRIRVPIQRYNESMSASYLLLGGAATKERTYEDLNVHSLQHPNYGLVRTDGVITEATTDNTAHQINWVMDRVQEHGIRSLAIFTSPYHLLRAFGTTIRIMQQRQMGWIPIVPISVGSLDDLVPELCDDKQLTSGFHMVAGEVERFHTYSRKRKPDVANYSQILDFMSWMRVEHPTMQRAA